MGVLTAASLIRSTLRRNTTHHAASQHNVCLLSLFLYCAALFVAPYRTATRCLAPYRNTTFSYCPFFSTAQLTTSPLARYVSPRRIPALLPSAQRLLIVLFAASLRCTTSLSAAQLVSPLRNVFRFLNLSPRSSLLRNVPLLSSTQHGIALRHSPRHNAT